MTRLYARLECRDGTLVSEPLDQHLYNVAVAAAMLAERLYRDRLAAEAACIAGAVHDAGKVLYNLLEEERIRRVEMEGCTRDWRLTFPYHEILSAALYAFTAWRRGLDTIDRIVSRAVLLHHQGLRGLEARTYIEGAAEVAARASGINGERLIAEVARLLRSIAERLSREPLAPCQAAVEKLASLADSLEEREATLPAVLEHAPIIVPEAARIIDARHARTARIAAGVLMIADNAVVKLCAPSSTEASVYVEEAKWLAKHLIQYECRAT